MHSSLNIPTVQVLYKQKKIIDRGQLLQLIIQVKAFKKNMKLGSLVNLILTIYLSHNPTSIFKTLCSNNLNTGCNLFQTCLNITAAYR